MQFHCRRPGGFSITGEISFKTFVRVTYEQSQEILCEATKHKAK